MDFTQTRVIPLYLVGSATTPSSAALICSGLASDLNFTVTTWMTVLGVACADAVVAAKARRTTVRRVAISLFMRFLSFEINWFCPAQAERCLKAQEFAGSCTALSREQFIAAGEHLAIGEGTSPSPPWGLDICSYLTSL